MPGVRRGAEGGVGMSRAGRIIFNLLALVSLAMLTFLTWLTWGDGRVAGYGRFNAIGYAGTCGFAVKRATPRYGMPLEWQFGGIIFVGNRWFASIYVSRWLALSLA